MAAKRYRSIFEKVGTTFRHRQEIGTWGHIGLFMRSKTFLRFGRRSAIG